jgi:anti-sigma28 factor (negative regulator of flagellin synthesis)
LKTNGVESTTAARVSGATSDAVIPAAAAPPDATPSAPVDRVSMDQLGRVKTSVEAGVTMAAAERSERLHSLVQAVRSGTYKPNASQLAAQILAEAELDAKLAKL